MNFSKRLIAGFTATALGLSLISGNFTVFSSNEVRENEANRSENMENNKNRDKIANETKSVDEKIKEAEAAVAEALEEFKEAEKEAKKFDSEINETNCKAKLDSALEELKSTTKKYIKICTESEHRKAMEEWLKKLDTDANIPDLPKKALDEKTKSVPVDSSKGKSMSAKENEVVRKEYKPEPVCSESPRNEAERKESKEVDFANSNSKNLDKKTKSVPAGTSTKKTKSDGEKLIKGTIIKGTGASGKIEGTSIKIEGTSSGRPATFARERKPQ